MRPYPTYWRRFLATAIDLCIVVILVSAISRTITVDAELVVSVPDEN